MGVGKTGNVTFYRLHLILFVISRFSPVRDPALPTISAAAVAIVAGLVAVVAAVVTSETVAVAHAVDAGLVHHRTRPPPGHGVRPELGANPKQRLSVKKYNIYIYSAFSFQTLLLPA